MAQLNFPILPGGLIVDVLVNLSAKDLLKLWSAGQYPPTIPARGLIDTGSDITAVALPIIRQLGLVAVSQRSTTGIGGQVQVNIYELCLSIRDQRNPTLPMLNQPSLLVMDLVPGFPYDVLIGMDVLRTCKLTVDGPAGTFALDF